MLPLLRDELRVALAPGQLVTVRLGWGLSRSGLVLRVKSKQVADCEPCASGEAPWEATLLALDAELAQLHAHKTAAKVILSSHFVRYSMMPWSETLSDAAEEEAYARHCFRQLYGADVEHWELRLSPQRPGLPQLASAVDRRLLAALRGVFKRNGVALESIQPSLMAAYNNSRSTLHNLNAWFALYEPGSLCIALLQQGCFSRVRTLRSGNNWRGTLSLALERETYMEDANESTRDVLLWAPDLDKPEFEKSELVQGGRWEIRPLHPLVRPALLPQYEDRFAMVLGC